MRHAGESFRGRRWRRIIPAFLHFCICAFLLSCTPRPSPGPPGAAIHVIHEGIHSGLLVPAEWLWPGPGVVEVGFGDAAWMAGDDRGCTHAAALGLWGADGAMYLRWIAPDAASAIARQRWEAVEIGLSPAGVAALRAELLSWIEPEGADLRAWVDGGVLRPSPRRFHVLRACHDQVAACLRAAGVPLAGSWLPWRTVAGFRREVADAVAELRGRGIRWVGPYADPPR